MGVVGGALASVSGIGRADYHLVGYFASGVGTGLWLMRLWVLQQWCHIAPPPIKIWRVITQRLLVVLCDTDFLVELELLLLKRLFLEWVKGKLRRHYFWSRSFNQTWRLFNPDQRALQVIFGHRPCAISLPQAMQFTARRHPRGQMSFSRLHQLW